ncbi:MAG: hypothetical protein KC505_07370 [Myxococcales bacterium]|nr:hypothetical protein [Myxococcales bacterium]USN50459.1 MAG: hypothetical protein H6731_09385 [Myxococcales bacterium]
MLLKKMYFVLTFWFLLFCIEGQTEEKAKQNASREIILHELQVENEGFLRIEYTNNFYRCARLVDSLGTTILEEDFFCSFGENISIKVPMNKVRIEDSSLKLCVGNYWWSTCSEIQKVHVPPHPITFRLQCDLMESLALETNEPFDCSAPSQAILEEAKERLSGYIDDLNIIFGKNTLRNFVMHDTEAILLYPDLSAIGFPYYDKQPYGDRFYIQARLTDNPQYGTYGGNAFQNIAWNLKWDKIHNPKQSRYQEQLLNQYWRQINHITHEFEHVFGAGSGEYYNLATARDTTGISPQVDISLSASNPYWSTNTDYFSDPLLTNIWNNSLVGRPSLYEELIDIVRFAHVTARIINSPSRLGAIDPMISVKNDIPDLENAKIIVKDSESNDLVENALVTIFNVRSFSPYVTTLLSQSTTDILGETALIFGCKNNYFPCLNNYEHLKLIKVSAAGYQSASRWYSIYDAQKDYLLGNNQDPKVYINLEKMVNASH